MLIEYQICQFLHQLKEKWMDLWIVGLGLSLDVLIYIIRFSKPESEDWRFNL